jgi:signal peptidase II
MRTLDARTGVLRLSLAVGGAILLLDELTKDFARRYLELCTKAPASKCDQVHVTGAFALLRMRNRGSAFGYSQGMWLWPVLAAMAFVAILWFGGRTKRSLSISLGTGLMVGGALGNLIDRIAFGGVTDFISFRAGALGGIAINIADVALAAGTVILTVQAYRRLSSQAPKPNLAAFPGMGN